MAREFQLNRDRSTTGLRWKFEFLAEYGRSVIPILQRYPTGEYRIVGTGTFIFDPYMFITAKHIFEGNDISVEDGFSIVVDGENEPVPIIQKWHDERYDIAFFRTENFSVNLNPIGVMETDHAVDEVVAVHGYSHSIVDPYETQVKEDGSIWQQIRLRSKWEVGSIQHIHENGNWRLRGELFETTVLVEGRDSGAPLFNSCGFMVGLVSSSWDFDSGMPNSTATGIKQISDLPIDGAPLRERWEKNRRSVVCKRIETPNKAMHTDAPDSGDL